MEAKLGCELVNYDQNNETLPSPAKGVGGGINSSKGGDGGGFSQGWFGAGFSIKWM